MATTLKTGVIRFTLDSANAGSASLWVGATGSPVDVNKAADAIITGPTLTGVDSIRLAGNANSSYDNFIYGNTASDVGAVPEPSSVALLGLFGGLALLHRRR